MNQFSWCLTVPLLAALLSTGQAAEAKYDVNRVAPKAGASPNRTSALCATSSSRSELDVNNVRAMVLNGGDMWWDTNSNPRYEIPKVTEPNVPRRHSIFAGALWIGGQDPGGALYVAAQTYRQGTTPDAGFWPGPLTDEGVIDADICAAWNSHAKVNRSIIDKFRSSPIPLDRSELPQSIRDWPARNNPYLTRPRLDQNLAPFVDVDGNASYDPLRGDYPDIRGDQAIWWAINDAGGAKYPVTPAIGLEIDIMAFAFSTTDLINNMTFYQQKIINKGQKILKNTYFGQWVDPDLGYFNDDYVGCDVSRGLGFCYNGDNYDDGVTGYGENPPTVAVDFFEGPKADSLDGIDNDRDSYSSGTFNPALVDEAGEKIIMSNFVYYNNNRSVNGNPTEAAHFYSYLRSRITTDVELKFGGDGISGTTTIPAVAGRPYAFMFPAGGSIESDPYGFGFHNPPITGQVPPFAWKESNTGSGTNVPADRRFLQSAGPFTLKPGAVNRITVGVIWGRAGAGGPQGSNGLVTFADDLAQGLFDNDFELPALPPTPIVTATALDRQIVLSIQPGSQLIKDKANGDRIMTTESFSLEDLSLPTPVSDKFFRFEGYLIYETIRENIGPDELIDPAKSRLIGRCDVINGITQLVNYEYNTDLNDVVPAVKVSANNSNGGIFHTFDVTRTQFSLSDNNRLVNFRRYYFQVVPYAANGSKEIGATNKPLVLEPFREGLSGKATAIPSNPVVLNGGTLLNSSVYSGISVTRELGIGTGGNVLEIMDDDEQEILRSNNKLQLKYELGKAPINVRVYDPLKVRDEQFRVKFSTYMSYLGSTVSGSRAVQKGDIIVSTGQYSNGEGRRVRSSTSIDKNSGIQKPGRAIVDSVWVTIVNGERRTALEVEMLNDDMGGTFMANVVRYTLPPIGDSSITGYEQEARNFETLDGQFKARASEFALHDMWKWKSVRATKWKSFGHRVSEVSEELIPEFGLSLQVRPAQTPGYRTNFSPAAQYLESSLKQGRPAWLFGVTNKADDTDTTQLGLPWLVTESRDPDVTPNTNAWDITATYSRLVPTEFPSAPLFFDTWAAYTNTQRVTTGYGAGYVREPTGRLNNLRNIDVVLTADKSKWTRVAVLQIASVAGGNSAQIYSLTKRNSLKPSINKDGQPDGSTAPSRKPSKGMGWFPGYAIDLDRGLRLNMAFSESAAAKQQGGQGLDKGTDLIWEPGETGRGAKKYAGRNFIYVTDTQYDEAREMERLQDTISAMPAGLAAIQFKQLYEQFMYVGYPQLIAGQKLLQNDARVRIRVNRAFTSYPGVVDNSNGPNQNPEYGFALQGQSVKENQREVACSALSLVRVVPNPYYAFSTYEEGRLATFSRITNLPRKAQITIYTLNGTLVRRINKDDAATFTDFNLRNEDSLPIASGIYLFHVKDLATGCEEIVKWFCIMRPVDLDSF